VNILIFNWRDIKHPEAGGAEIFLHQIASGCVQQGHSVTIVASRYPNCTGEENVDGVRIIRKGGKYSFWLIPLFECVLRLKYYRPDVIVESLSKLPHFMPVFVRRPYLVIIHHIHAQTLFKELPLPIALGTYVMERLLPLGYRQSSFITVSPSTQQELIRMGIPESHISLIYNGINQQLFQQASGVQKSAKPLVAYVGRVKRYKRISHLIEAFQIVKEQIPDAELVIAGKGSAHEELEQLVKQRGLHSVRFIRHLTDDEKAHIMRSAWVYVSTSMKEGWGITVIESSASGTPVIGYNVPGIRDSIRDGETGLLVSPPGDIKQLAKAIIRVLEDQELRRTLSENAVKWAQNFTWEKAVDGFTALLSRITAEQTATTNVVES